MIYKNTPTSETEIVCDEALLEAGFFDEIDKWKRANQDSDKKTYKNTMLTDDEYAKIKELIDTMTTVEEYSEYKKAFDKFCYFCHIVPRGVVLYKYKLKKGKADHHSLDVTYTYNTKRMKLPEGTPLYHMSKVPNITALKPTFRGKAVRGFLYDKPRIYFTIRKSMPKIWADYKANEKMHMYEAKDPIRNVFVDPLLWGYASGAVYVEVNKDIPVTEITEDKKKDKEEAKNESAITESVECVNNDSLFDFINESGILFESYEE